MKIDEARKQQDAIYNCDTECKFFIYWRNKNYSLIRCGEYNTAQDSVNVVKNKTSKDALQ